MARPQSDTPLVLLGLWTISLFTFSSCPVRPELHKGLISELQNYEIHKMKPNWVGKMWWLEIWFSCRVYSPLQLNCFWVLEFQRNSSQRLINGHDLMSLRRDSNLHHKLCFLGAVESQLLGNHFLGILFQHLSRPLRTGNFFIVYIRVIHKVRLLGGQNSQLRHNRASNV
jgi:hypothetical protein